MGKDKHVTSFILFGLAAFFLMMALLFFFMPRPEISGLHALADNNSFLLAGTIFSCCGYIVFEIGWSALTEC